VLGRIRLGAQVLLLAAEATQGPAAAVLTSRYGRPPESF
jgi:hypothetical protein